MTKLPDGWMIKETQVELAKGGSELVYQVYFWATRTLKKHWWSRPKKKTGWFPYGVPCYNYETAVKLINMVDERPQ